MTSQIQPDAIDVTFPVAGQDNDSQGFRDNFSIIQNSLATASSEITDLQTNAARLDVDNNFSGTIIGNAQTNRLYGTVFTLSTAPGTNSIDYEQGELYVITLTGNSHSIRFDNWPRGKNNTEVYAKIKVLIKNGRSPQQIITQGIKYVITSRGTFDWSSVGASDNSVGTIFTATTTANTGSSESTVTEVLTVNFTGVTITGSGSNSFEVGLGVITVEAWTPDNGTNVYLTTLGDFSSSFVVNDLNDVGNVSITDPVEGGQILKLIEDQPGVYTWINADHSLNDLGDVNINVPQEREVLKYSGLEWVNSPLTVSDISNIVLTAPVNDGDFLRYDLASQTWRNTTLVLSEYTGSESQAVTLSNSVSYFDTAGTFSLPAGTNGQVKVLAMSSTAAVIIGVNDAGWSNVAGNITFTTIGQACTLQFFNGKWFCIGNNGAVFA